MTSAATTRRAEATGIETVRTPACTEQGEVDVSKSGSNGPRRRWAPILEHAASIVGSYETSVTLRQLFYRLVADGTLQNTRSDYSSLSRVTAEARRAGTFPALLDRTRGIERAAWWSSPVDALASLERQYRRDRTEGQPFNIYLGIEKAGQLALLDAWFGDLGLPLIALGGYNSQTFEAEIGEDIRADGRPSVLLYAGDWDPSGEDILRNLCEHVRFDQVHRVALSAEQVAEYALPEAFGKTTDSRARGFIERHGRLAQVELDALPPEALRGLYAAALAPLRDESIYRVVLEHEAEDRDHLSLITRSVSDRSFT